MLSLVAIVVSVTLQSLFSSIVNNYSVNNKIKKCRPQSNGGGQVSDPGGVAECNTSVGHAIPNNVAEGKKPKEKIKSVFHSVVFWLTMMQRLLKF